MVRLALLLTVDYKFNQGDAVEYDRLGRNIVEHDTLSLEEAAPFTPTLRRAPLFPAELALIYRSFGHRYVAVQALQVAMDIGSCLLLSVGVGLIAPSVARLSLWLICLSPYNALYSGALLSETLCTFFLICGIVLPLLIRSRGRWLLAGASLGLAALARDIYLALIPMVAVFWSWGPTWRCVLPPAKGRIRVLAASALVIGAVLAILPWTVRNHRISQHWVPVSKGILGQAIWIGTWEVNGAWEAAGVASVPPESYRTPAERAAVETAVREDGVARDKAMFALAFDRIRTEPLHVFSRWIRRAPRMWFGTRFELFGFKQRCLSRGKPLWLTVKAILFVGNFAVLILALLGILWAAREARALLYLAVPIVYNLLIFLPLHSTEPRYSQPVYPFVVVFAAAGLLTVHRWYQAREGKSGSQALNSAPQTP